MNLNPMNLDYKKIFKGLNQAGIDYLVVGGLAVNFHGIPRMTYDLDLMLLLEPGNISKMVDRLTRWGYRPRAPVDPRDLADATKRESWVKEKEMKAFSFNNPSSPIGEIDLVIESPIPYERLKARAIGIMVEEITIPVISLDDLILIKEKSGRRQDLMDMEYLRKIKEK
jgi:predicted nucleotidyltransferase